MGKRKGREWYIQITKEGGGRQEGAEKINSNKFGLRIKIKGYRGIGSPQPFILPHLCYPFSMLRLSTFDLTVRQDHPPSPREAKARARAIFSRLVWTEPEPWRRFKNLLPIKT